MMMKYKSEIIVPITLANNAASIKFSNKILVSLDCFICKRSRRTVVLYEDQEKSFCTPSKHQFPGRITQIDISERENADLVRQRSVVTATYCIEYEFEEFIDEKVAQSNYYSPREISPKPTWSRATFQLTCICGEQTQQETQNNLGRPTKLVCKCGKDIYYEIEPIPLFKHTVKLQ